MFKTEEISILGCGWYGFALAKHLISLGLKVKGSSTSERKLGTLSAEGIQPFIIKIEEDAELYDDSFFKCDLLIISIPPDRKSGQGSAYPQKIKRISEIAIKNKVKNILFISSVSVYGDQNQEVYEDSEARPDSESGIAILEAEAVLRNSNALVTILRFGGLIGPDRNPGRFFAGKQSIPNGKAPVNLIHLNDCLGITAAIIQTGKFGNTFNACSNEHPTRMDFYRRSAIDAGLEPPVFIDELRGWKIVSSNKIRPLLQYTVRSLTQ